jgi:hypothetical protein
MTTRTLALVAVLVSGAAGPVIAQSAAAAPQPPQVPRARGVMTPPAEAPRVRTPEAQPPAAASPAERPRREGQPVNIKIDLTLTDQRGGAAAIKRTVTVLAADGYTGSIRTSSQVLGMGNPVPLNVDASPTLLADGKLRLGLNLQYDWPNPAPTESNPRAAGTVLNTSLHDQLMLILENGKVMTVAQSADPVGDRQVTIEVKATILK